ncbi:MAG: hypothetical protein OXN17_03010 [Candidatus Poribacteria bacterium]|nr:hypothetical protein [Candidatus Poribacteria bacterium]MDE0502493.1 hypothetical protein [Candidatus Poribacteria bacterium]
MAQTTKFQALARKRKELLFYPKPERRQRTLRLHSSTSFDWLNLPVKSSSGLMQAKTGECCLAIDWGFDFASKR